MKQESVIAFAPVGIKSGKIGRNLAGRYAVYSRMAEAERDCASYQRAQRVRITVMRKQP